MYANSVDPEKMAHMSILIWIYTACPAQTVLQACSAEMVKDTSKKRENATQHN